ncbi:helix-turn-helix domain-containing protein [Aquiflexum sp.]|uniref:helix-turn-helix domain-containing protein n=1 Tax=Aquiflexum sp. TaxID=1872584 RepID=UPI0035943423
MADFKFFHPPHPELKGFINRIMLCHYHFDSGGRGKVYPHPPVPDHTLIFYLNDHVTCRNYFKDDTFKLPTSIVIGPQVNRVDLTMGKDLLVIPVVFAPGGLHRMLGVPMYEMLGYPFDSTLFLGREIGEVNEKLLEATDYYHMVLIVENFLLQKVRKLKQILPIDMVLGELASTGQNIKIDQISHKACISVRQLERQFKERIGVTPKTYTKLLRLTKAWKFFENNPQATWSQIAHLCQYADQMHLIRDFKEFTGLTPTALEARLNSTDLRIQSETFE